MSRELSKHHALQSVQLSTIAHATDDLQKVQKALRLFLPDSLRERELFTRAYLQGHHGNPIVTFKAKLTKPREVDQFSQHLAGLIPKTERQWVAGNLRMHSDEEGNLFMRFDKQQAFRGVIGLSNEDPIRVRLKFSRLGGETEKLMREFLESD